jgi:TolB protein
MVKYFYLVLLSVGLLSSELNANTTRVTKLAKGFTANPGIAFNRITGDAQLSAWVGQFLQSCGWFKVAPAGTKTTYALNGSVSNGFLNLTIYNESGMVWFRVSERLGGTKRQVAAKAVDQVLNKIFKIPGICNSNILFCAQTSRKVKNIYSCGIEGAKGKVKQLTAYRTMCVEPEWFPNSKSIVYTRYATGATAIVQTAFGRKIMSRIIAAYPGTNAGAAISANGKYLAFVASKGRMVDLYLKAVDSRARRQLTNDTAVDATPCWSPRGDKICFVSNRITGRPRLWIISANGGTPQRLTTLGSEAVAPSWSEEGIIAYAARMGRNYTIALVDPSGKTSSKVLVKIAGDWESPSWAPDSRHIVCSRTYNGRSMLYIIDSWTGKMRLLLKGTTNFTMPNWSKVIK